MNKISSKELASIKKNLFFYDFNKNNSSNGKLLLRFNEDYEVTRYGDIQYGGIHDNFINDAKVLVEFIVQLIVFFNPKEILLIKYESKWIVDKNISNNICKYLQNNKIRLNYSGAIVISDKNILEEFIFSNIKYNSFTHFVLPDKYIIITPTDHMDVFISSDNLDYLYQVASKIKKIVDVNNLLSIKKIA